MLKYLYFNVFTLNRRIIPLSCSNIIFIRTKSSSNLDIKTYSFTILSPKTAFPARNNNVTKEDVQKDAQFSELYLWQREHINGPEFVLHDGPPYANGDLHMGHAVNKIIKDICNRNQIIQGNKVHYIPGWDCHGLPIELKALQNVKRNKSNAALNPVSIRQIAREFALNTVAAQKDAFKKWGIMADWEHGVYLTVHKEYIKNQLKQFYTMYKKGLIFRALKPVYWSPSSRTALAEAELEYDPQHKSKEVYIRFLLDNIPDKLRNLTDNMKVYGLVWTTTPWTLVANRGICYNHLLKYGLVKLSKFEEDALYIVSLDLLDSLQKILSVDVTIVSEFQGSDLKECTYRKTLTDKIYSFLDSDHVTASKGTGLVHMAPAHGPEDFLVALKNNMVVDCNVDESGRYQGLGPELNGLYVLKEGQDAIIKALGDAVLHQDWYTHSYPLDWRTKKPIIVRASQQWFIDTGALKSRALKVLQDVNILPQTNAEQYRQGLKTQLEKRPYWCISRQRAWGTAIPVVYDGETPIVDDRIIDNLCKLMEEKGPDAWWTCSVEELLTQDIVQDYNLQNKTLTKGKDILDIWFDSGLSWSSVLDGRTADVYVEGVDQFTGWFQSSLLTSVALQDKAPYKSILVHGFVVDEHKRKMSKSIGNVIDPLTIVCGGKNKSQPAFGIDTLRWWVASHGTQHTQIVISKQILEDCQKEIIRIRNIMKFLLGVVSDLDTAQFELQPNLNYLDKHLVQECYKFDRSVTEYYNSFKYNNTAQTVNNFISNEVSALYCHCVKDRLYCSAKNSAERISSQLVIHTILVTLCKALAPILPHLVEEVWKYHPLYAKPFFFTERIPVLPESSLDNATMDLVLDIKKEMHSAVKSDSLKKFTVKIKADNKVYSKLKELNARDGFNDSVLAEILEVANVDLEEVDNFVDWQFQMMESTSRQCLRCRKYNALDDSDKCERCEAVLRSQ